MEEKKKRKRALWLSDGAKKGKKRRRGGKTGRLGEKAIPDCQGPQSETNSRKVKTRTLGIREKTDSRKKKKGPVGGTFEPKQHLTKRSGGERWSES